MEVSGEVDFLKVLPCLNGFGLFDKSIVLEVGAYFSYCGVKVSCAVV
jgi:hypothetical protein